MSNEVFKDTFDALDELLDEERSALVKGDFDRMNRLQERKTSLIERLSELETRDHEEMQAISAKIGRNQALLNSAIEGIRAVAARLAAVRHVRESLQTYDAAGKRKTIKTNVDKSLEKRA